MPWLNRCGAFLMEFMIWRTPDGPCRRSRLDEFNVDVDCIGCGLANVTLLLLLSKMVGIAVDVWPKPLLPLENKFNSLAVDGVPLLLDERRRRNDNDFKRFSFVESRVLCDDDDDGGGGGDNGFCRSSNVDTNWSKTFKSAFILEFRIVLAFIALLPPLLPFDDSPRRWVICGTLISKRDGEREKTKNGAIKNVWNFKIHFDAIELTKMNYAVECIRCISKCLLKSSPIQMGLDGTASHKLIKNYAQNQTTTWPWNKKLVTNLWMELCAFIRHSYQCPWHIHHLIPQLNANKHMQSQSHSYTSFFLLVCFLPFTFPPGERAYHFIGPKMLEFWHDDKAPNDFCTRFSLSRIQMFQAKSAHTHTQTQIQNNTTLVFQIE